jgi:hypothetical protein
MVGLTRGIATLAGVAIAGFLIWLGGEMGTEGPAEYWATYGLVAAAGLTMALSQVLGGWTKWGWPRLSPGVFLLGFLPVAFVGVWVLFAEQPGDPALATESWSEDLGVGGVVAALGELVAAVAFGVGLVLGLTFDTTGPRLEPPPGEPLEYTREPEQEYEPRAADEPLTAEREATRGRRHDAYELSEDPSRNVQR